MNSSIMFFHESADGALNSVASVAQFDRSSTLPHKDWIYHRIYDGDFNVFSIGHEYSTPDKAFINRKIYNHIYFHYVIDGEGFYNGVPIGAGMGFVSLPQETHTLISSPDNPLHFYWLDFYGQRAEAYVASLGFAPNRLFFPFTWADELRTLLDGLLYVDHSHQNLTLLLEGVLRAALSWHIPLDEPQKSGGKMMDHIKAAEQYIHAQQGIVTCDEVARACGLTRKYLNRLFVRYRGKSLQSFVMTVRMNCAADLLRSGIYLGKEVASMVGYTDYALFSKMFKKYHHFSPTEYARVRRQK